MDTNAVPSDAVPSNAVPSFIIDSTIEELEASDPKRAAVWQASEQLRLVLDRMVDTAAPESEIRALAAQAKQMADTLGGYDFGRNYANYQRAPGGGPPSGHSDFSPLLGKANAIAPPMVFSIEQDPDSDTPTVVADVTFGNAYEGPPGNVHGGLVAAAFDEVLGAVQAFSGQPGMTGTLNVVYRRPTPLNVALRFEGSLDDVQGRKIFTSGRLYSTDADDPNGEVHLRAEATGIFISIDFEKLAAAASQIPK